MKKLTLFVATGFGLGLVAPVAPGTIGSLPGVALSYAVCALPLWLQIPVCLGFTLLAIPFCDVAEKLLGVKDDGRITADEWMLYPIALVGLPLGALPWWSMVVFFVVVRIVDILKPWPVHASESWLPAGWGIMIDDVFAGLWALLCVSAALALIHLLWPGTITL